jgi:hypothetical protein
MHLGPSSDPAARFATGYFRQLLRGDIRELRAHLVPGAAIDDQRNGQVSGDLELPRFLEQSMRWLRDADARVLPIRTTSNGARAVAESVLQLMQVELPVAVVAETHGKGIGWLRIYHGTFPLTGSHWTRKPALLKNPLASPPDVIGVHHRALAAGDLDALTDCFEADAIVRDPSGGMSTYQGRAELRYYYSALFAHGTINLEICSITDDGTCCALEYNMVGWGRGLMDPQPGVAVYQRGPTGRISSLRAYDDIAPPGTRP